MSESAKIVVCAYHNVGFRCLGELLRQGARVAAVFTHEDSSSEEIWFSSVKELAERNGIPCHVGDVNLPENMELLREIGPDFLFSFYYRFMINKEILDIPKRGALNLHGSLLPKYRGRVPINWAVINGEKETGATLHYMVEKPDAGDIVDQEKVSIEFSDSARDVFQKVTDAAVRLIGRSWPLLLAGKAARNPMDLSSGSYYGGRKPSDGLIDWTRSAVGVYNLVRGVTHPYPGAFTFLDGRKVFVWEAWPVAGTARAGEIVSDSPLLVGTGDGLLEIRSLQIEHGGEMGSAEFALKHPVAGKYFHST
ncbi:MAG: formyltransferase [Deltaproteobacteria bacterium]|nr:formyltransferase [Deltaproteobacteria bacterium]